MVNQYYKYITGLNLISIFNTSKILLNISSISFEDVENGKEFIFDENGGKNDETNKQGNEHTKNLETADYRAIATIYKAITEYRQELRKLQEFQREEIRYNRRI